MARQLNQESVFRNTMELMYDVRTSVRTSELGVMHHSNKPRTSIWPDYMCVLIMICSSVSDEWYWQEWYVPCSTSTPMSQLLKLPLSWPPWKRSEVETGWWLSLWVKWYHQDNIEDHCHTVKSQLPYDLAISKRRPASMRQFWTK